MIDLIAVQDANEDEYGRFERISAQPWTQRPDLHAFMMLDRLMPGNRDMVSASEHDEIWLDVDCAILAEAITEAQFIDLMRCGVRYDNSVESLALFV